MNKFYKSTARLLAVVCIAQTSAASTLPESIRLAGTNQAPTFERATVQATNTPRTQLSWWDRLTSLIPSFTRTVPQVPALTTQAPSHTILGSLAQTKQPQSVYSALQNAEALAKQAGTTSSSAARNVALIGIGMYGIGYLGSQAQRKTPITAQEKQLLASLNVRISEVLGSLRAQEYVTTYGTIFIPQNSLQASALTRLSKLVSEVRTGNHSAYSDEFNELLNGYLADIKTIRARTQESPERTVLEKAFSAILQGLPEATLDNEYKQLLSATRIFLSTAPLTHANTLFNKSVIVSLSQAQIKTLSDLIQAHTLLQARFADQQESFRYKTLRSQAAQLRTILDRVQAIQAGTMQHAQAKPTELEKVAFSVPVPRPAAPVQQETQTRPQEVQALIPAPYITPGGPAVTQAPLVEEEPEQESSIQAIVRRKGEANLDPDERALWNAYKDAKERELLQEIDIQQPAIVIQEPSEPRTEPSSPIVPAVIQEPATVSQETSPALSVPSIPADETPEQSPSSAIIAAPHGSEEDFEIVAAPPAPETWLSRGTSQVISALGKGVQYVQTAVTKTMQEIAKTIKNNQKVSIDQALRSTNEFRQTLSRQESYIFPAGSPLLKPVRAYNDDVIQYIATYGEIDARTVPMTITPEFAARRGLYIIKQLMTAMDDVERSLNRTKANAVIKSLLEEAAAPWERMYDVYALIWGLYALSMNDTHSHYDTPSNTRIGFTDGAFRIYDPQGILRAYFDALGGTLSDSTSFRKLGFIYDRPSTHLNDIVELGGGKTGAIGSAPLGIDLRFNKNDSPLFILPGATSHILLGSDSLGYTFVKPEEFGLGDIKQILGHTEGFVKSQLRKRGYMGGNQEGQQSKERPVKADFDAWKAIVTKYIRDAQRAKEFYASDYKKTYLYLMWQQMDAFERYMTAASDEPQRALKELAAFRSYLRVRYSNLPSRLWQESILDRNARDLLVGSYTTAHEAYASVRDALRQLRALKRANASLETSATLNTLVDQINILRADTASLAVTQTPWFKTLAMILADLSREQQKELFVRTIETPWFESDGIPAIERALWSEKQRISQDEFSDLSQRLNSYRNNELAQAITTIQKAVGDIISNTAGNYESAVSSFYAQQGISGQVFATSLIPFFEKDMGLTYNAERWQAAAFDQTIHLGRKLGELRGLVGSGTEAAKAKDALNAYLASLGTELENSYAQLKANIAQPENRKTLFRYWYAYLVSIDVARDAIIRMLLDAHNLFGMSVYVGPDMQKVLQDKRGRLSPAERDVLSSIYTQSTNMRSDVVASFDAYLTYRGIPRTSVPQELYTKQLLFVDTWLSAGYDPYVVQYTLVNALKNSLPRG